MLGLAMITKAPGPDESLKLGKDGDPVLASFYRLMRLKRLYRQGWLKRGIPKGICESVAEHSFGTALLGLLLTAGEGPAAGRGLDPAKVVLMALVHEMGESYAGDITPVDGVTKEDKLRLEREAIDRSLAGHPEAAWFLSLWEEFEEGGSAEARYVRELDRLEMGLEAALYRSEGYAGMEEFFASSRRVVAEPRLRAILEEAIAASTTMSPPDIPPERELPPPPVMPPMREVPAPPDVPAEPAVVPPPLMPNSPSMPDTPLMPEAPAMPGPPSMPPPPAMPAEKPIPPPPSMPPPPDLPPGRSSWAGSGERE
jgi:putative hydrolase of HD superfamily